ncbi:MAG: flagellar type III secretion system protein FliQ [Calditrichae bacterium]|nr:flagellar type III secretion system protein FliQ [Calditrichia bacterium]
MTEEFAIQFLTDAIYTTILVAGPILLVTLLIGFLIGVFQAVTSINEMTLTFIPKMIGVVVVLLLLLPWIIKILQTFAITVFNLIPTLGS